MLSAADLAYTRQTQGLTLSDRAIVRHTTTESDGMGGSNQVTSYTGDIPCRVAPMRVQAAEPVMAGQITGDLPWEVTVPVGTTVDLSDRINVGGALSGTPPSQTVDGGRWFEVLAIYGDWTNSTALQLLCAERDNG
jgi:hypothetical protein